MHCCRSLCMASMCLLSCSPAICRHLVQKQFYTSSSRSHCLEGSRTFKVAAMVCCAYTGFDLVATLVEKTKDPLWDIPLGLVGSMTRVTVLYCMMSPFLVMMQKYLELDVNVAYSVAFTSVGMEWVKHVMAVGALKGMTTGPVLGLLGQDRYMTRIARDCMIPLFFTPVHPKMGTRTRALLLITSYIVTIVSSFLFPKLKKKLTTTQRSSL